MSAQLAHLPQLVVLFFVIFDPLASFAVYFGLTRGMAPAERRRVATLGLGVAAGLSAVVLLLGPSLLVLFSTTVDQFKVAGGIVLGLLGLKMALGESLAGDDTSGERSAQAVAAIIGTPLLTGPATITAIIVSVQEDGFLPTTLAVTAVLLFTAALFAAAPLVARFVNRTFVQVTSTLLGLITLAWGVRFVVEGLLALMASAGR
ncbi:MAG: MarC family protein [Deltaproteobacteria bacterium]|nr:MarC family protein [Deltaproteobacteria bacterium]